MFAEFKKFIMRGNVLDLAVAVIIGGAFGKIVTSMVEDIIMPLIGLIVGKLNFSDLYLPLNGQALGLTIAEAKKGGAILTYGNFLTNILNFLIVAFCIFLMVKAANSFKKPEPVAAATTKDCPQCAMSIPIAAKKCGHCASML
jgi:large conductance mechanosensitive channel